MREKLTDFHNHNHENKKALDVGHSKKIQKLTNEIKSSASTSRCVRYFRHISTKKFAWNDMRDVSSP